MSNLLKQLRDSQKYADLDKLEKDIYISIDRLTVLLDSQRSLRKIFKELKASLILHLSEFDIQENFSDDTFTLYKSIENDQINIIFFISRQ